MEKLFVVLGALLGGLAVALGAFGAHGLQGRLTPDLLQVYETGVRYHFYHALALFAVVMAMGRWPNTAWLAAAGWLFVVGILIFSGSLYALALSGVRWLGAITPLGGVAFIAGWICLAWGVWRG
ncbi:DUF423 domain-containing protein [Litorilinea aerophila]|uniref:DUF423 domain-containing protein n=1 Tax=Litorilinea aerophila TaxID=1204385 RepID=A0A540VKF2_9CHLR|nr:DUF423 domain-containing protein [Litorilinea aerophila]MCC9075823.1 DUF423 domain-containing protein [Litorilinea aerophila]OUC08732.1 membrane protein [Litorilinea aerophila]